jgi:hypothetical protein
VCESVLVCVRKKREVDWKCQKCLGKSQVWEVDSCFYKGEKVSAFYAKRVSFICFVFISFNFQTCNVCSLIVPLCFQMLYRICLSLDGITKNRVK